MGDRKSPNRKSPFKTQGLDKSKCALYNGCGNGKTNPKHTPDTMNHYRQGDILIIAVPTINGKEQSPNGRIILAEGEVTGHAHAIADPTVTSYVGADGTLYLDAPKGADVRHEEHATITLPPGKYRVMRQREYTPESIRNVAD